MDDVWIQALRILDANVNSFVDDMGDAKGHSYQLKVDALRSVATRSISGELRHLPTKKRIAVAIRLPI